jgi:hypothetical protein
MHNARETIVRTAERLRTDRSSGSARRAAFFASTLSPEPPAKVIRRIFSLAYSAARAMSGKLAAGSCDSGSGIGSAASSDRTISGTEAVGLIRNHAA